MLAHANLPISFWGDALLTTAYIEVLKTSLICSKGFLKRKVYKDS